MKPNCLALIFALAPLIVVKGFEPIDIGARRELFVDEHLIEELRGSAELRLHHPVAREVAIRFDQPWEGNTSGYVTVMRDGEILKMIYRGHRMVWDEGKLQMSHSPVACYAESCDGLKWTKPELRLFPWRGKDADKLADPLANNIVWPGSSETNTFVPFLDTRPGCPPEEKFKAVGGVHKTGLFLFKSPDAIHWSRSDQPIFKQGALDSMNVVFWEPRQKHYVLYYRTVVDGLRSVSMTSSPDLLEWSEPVALEYPGSPPQQMYTNQIAPYYRAPHVRLGFPTRYTARAMNDQLRALEPTELRAELTAAYARVGSDLTDGLFMSSRDGVRFRRWDEAFLRPGPQADPLASRWIYGDNYQNYGLFETASDRPGAPDEISMLFSEGYWRDGDSRLRRHTIRLDGFVSVQAPYAGGEIVTKPITFSGGHLTLNYATSAAGSVRVELQTADGDPIDGFLLDDSVELVGDHVEQVVRWGDEADVGALAGQSVRLRFVVRDADLFSFQFDGTAQNAEASVVAETQAPAAEPSATFEQITQGPKHHFFGYVGHGGTIPWNASDRFLVALRVDFHDRMPKPEEAAEIVLVDTQNGCRIEPLDRTLAWNLQQGTMLFWNPDAAETQFLFNDKDPATGVVFTVLYDISERRRIREFRFGNESIANGGVSPAGRYFAGINYGKITRSREVISYPGATDHTVDENPANPETDGVFRIEIATGERQLLVSYAQLSDLILTSANNRERLGDPGKYPIYAHHTMWSRDGEWIFFLVRGKQNKRPDQACAVRFDGSNLRKVPYAGHPEWSANNELILASKEHGSFNLYDVAAEKWTGQLGAPGVFPDTRDDNALSPDRSWYVGSQKIEAECFYTLFRLADGHWFRAPPIPTKAGGGVVRIDPAPRWNRSGDTILVPGLAEDGTRQLFLVRIDSGALAGEDKD